MSRPTGGHGSQQRPRTIRWDGTAAQARIVTDWARDSALNTRFMWVPHLHGPGDARTLVEQPGQSSEWVATPIGSVIERTGSDVDDTLIVHLPPDPIEILSQPRENAA